MALVLKDRVKETTTTTGTGTYTLAGAVGGFEAFSEVGDGNTTYYACTDGTDFEVGIGTYTASGTTLARTTILQSSNSDNAVSWTAGTRTIFCTLPAEKMIFEDASDSVNTGLSFEDNVKVQFGAGDDLQIYHDGTHNYIRVPSGQGNLRLQTGVFNVRSANNNLNQIVTIDSGSVELYYNGAKKIETASGGVTVTGTMAATAVTGDGSGLTNLPETGDGGIAMAIALG